MNAAVCVRVRVEKWEAGGNDFVVCDARARGAGWTIAIDAVRALSDRTRGIGCDQFIVLRDMPGRAADTPRAVRMELWNADGSRTHACGNATRCIGLMCADESGSCVVCTTDGAELLCRVEHMAGPGVGRVAVRMRPPTGVALDVQVGAVEANGEGVCALGLACTVDVGNPHAVFFHTTPPNLSADDATCMLAPVGAALQSHPLFPRATNVELAWVTGDAEVHAVVWERGVGPTLCCGTGACAVVVSAVEKKLLRADTWITVVFPGGTVDVRYAPPHKLTMRGGARHVFTATINSVAFPQLV